MQFIRDSEYVLLEVNNRRPSVYAFSECLLQGHTYGINLQHLYSFFFLRTNVLSLAF